MGDKFAKKRIRGSKTTEEQFRLYVDLLESDPYFRENAFKPGEDPNKLKLMWSNITNALNSAGGPQKDVKAWKKTFSNWKCSVRSKARAINLSFRQTGNQGPPEVPLNSLEEKLMNLTGKVVVDGMNLPELGIDDPTIEIKPTEVGYDDDDEVTLMRCIQIPPEQCPQTSSQGIGANSFQGRKKITPRKKNMSLHAALTGLSENANSDNNALQSINKHLEELVKIERQRLHLQQLEFQIKYPNYNFIDVVPDENLD